MCGIACYVGKNAGKNCFEALEKLEYRGYDSAGIAGIENEQICVFKKRGRVNSIKDFALKMQSGVAIAHTRWATHGGANEQNAHPHLSFDGNIALVHNGIIENYQSLRTELLMKGVGHKSETDTEVALNLVATESGELREKVKKARNKLVGSYAFVFLDRAGTIVALRNKSPLYLAQNQDGIMLSSDVLCFFSLYDNFYPLSENDIVEIKDGVVKIYDENLEEKRVEFKPLNKKEAEISLLGYPYFMEKEIHEIPKVIGQIENRYKSGEEFEKVKDLFSDIDNIAIVGCGTAYHAALYGAKVLENKLGIRADAFVASELKYANKVLGNTLGIFVSQSGETADTLGCVNIFKERGFKTIALTNNTHSTLSRLCDQTLPVCAGVEIAVASTKAYVAQILVFICLAYYLSGEKRNILKGLSSKAKKLLSIDKRIVKDIKSAKQVFFIGREKDSVTALESALKLKEITYKSAEGYSAGELKHGTLALIEEGTPVVVFASVQRLAQKTLASAEEAKARGAKIILVAPKAQKNLKCDYFVALPNVDFEELYGALSILPFQLLAYEVSLDLGYNPDMPRNLAKSVTVE